MNSAVRSLQREADRGARAPTRGSPDGETCESLHWSGIPRGSTAARTALLRVTSFGGAARGRAGTRGESAEWRDEKGFLENLEVTSNGLDGSFVLELALDA